MTSNHTAGEGGIFSGKSVLGTMLAQFLVQVIIVIVLSRLFDAILRFLRQPRVIAEVISGICLGPSVLGRIPGFTETIFPPESIEPMKLVANIGLVLYMFLVGLELDPRSFFANIKTTALISIGGMVLPFVLGVALSWGLYVQLLDNSHDVPFSSFLLFTGVAMSITAFPVLARILSERRLFGTTVGSMAISSAAFNDATAWCLLALVLSIINAQAPINALWVFLTMLVYVLLLLFLVRWLLAKFVRVTMRSRRFATATIGQTFLAFVFVFIFISSWITEFIGVHAIFGAFLVGVIMPRGVGIVVSLTEKIEDLVSTVLLPLYFVSSGLKTHINLLDDGRTWGWLICAILVACVGKVFGCMFAGKLTKMSWRESLSVGILMNTKGLVELIVLNIGVDAGVINDRIFAIMLIMCLVTTFMTSPLISVVYPKHHQVSVEDAMRAEAKRAVNKDDKDGRDELWTDDGFNMLACVDRLEQVPSIVTLASKFRADTSDASGHGHKATPFRFNALRLMEASERSSTMFYAASSPNISPAQNDPVLQMMSLFSRLMKVTAKFFYAVSPVDAYHEEVDRIAGTEHCNMLLMTVNVDGGDDMAESVLKHRTHGLIPLLYVDRKSATEAEVIAYSTGYPNNAVNDAYTIPTPDSTPSSGLLRILVPFEGGRTDRKALRVALRLGLNPSVHLTILYVTVVDSSRGNSESNGKPKQGAISYISSKLHSDHSKNDYDAEIMAEAKRQSADRPQSIVVRAVTTNNMVDCIVAECKQSTIDLVVLGYSAPSSSSSGGGTWDRRGKKRSIAGELGRIGFDGTAGASAGVVRKRGGDLSNHSSLRESLRKRSRIQGWTWGPKENILGAVGHRLLRSTEASLLVVGQGAMEETTTHI